METGNESFTSHHDQLVLPQLEVHLGSHIPVDHFQGKIHTNSQLIVGREETWK